jgi:hypothetical protein
MQLEGVLAVEFQVTKTRAYKVVGQSQTRPVPIRQRGRPTRDPKAQRGKAVQHRHMQLSHGGKAPVTGRTYGGRAPLSVHHRFGR